MSIGGPDGFAENEPRMHLSMESKMYGFPKENEGFLVSRALTPQTGSQKMSLECTSVWRAKCMDFHRKMKDFWFHEH